MKHTILFLNLILLGCFYGKIKLNSSDKNFIPYRGRINQLIFTNNNGIFDTVTLRRTIPKTTNFDHFINRTLYNDGRKKKLFYECYSTEISLSRTLRKVESKQSYIKFTPFIFTFFKSELDTTVKLHYSFDRRWNGDISFDTLKTSILKFNNKVYNDVFVIMNNSDDNLFEIRKIYWSKTYGLVRIEEKNSMEWTLIKKE